jgi:uncharacterized membrane protein
MPSRSGSRSVHAFSRATLLVFVAVTWIAFAACGGDGPSGENCPNDVPSSCPGTAPSYAADIAPILSSRCRACHTAGGIESTQSFDTYADVQSRRSGILTQLHACLMPPADQAQPTAVERQKILAWLVCGAMNN